MANITAYDAQLAAPAMRALSDASIRSAQVPMIRVIAAPNGTTGLQEKSAQPTFGVVVDVVTTVRAAGPIASTAIPVGVANGNAATVENTGTTDPGRSTWSPPV